MHLVLGQALERYGTASGASAGGRAGAGGLQALTTSWVHLPPSPAHLTPHSSAGQAWGWGWGAEQELDWVFQL